MLSIPLRIRFGSCPIIYLSFLLLSIQTSAQEQLGMRLERYAGLYGAALNPAHTAFTPHRWEVSLFEADGFFDNNYGYLRETGLPHALRHTDEIVTAGEASGENPPSGGAIIQDYFTNRRKMYAVAQGRLSGPALGFRLGDNHFLGLVTALRASAGVFGIPEALRYDRLESRRRFEVIDVPPFGGGAMAWGEVGLHYSRRSTDRAITTAWGVTPKLLLGFEGGYARAGADFQYAQQGGDTIAFASAEWEYALTTGNLGATDSVGKVRPSVNGYGAGLDVGFVWAMPADDGDTDEDYLWRIGISVIDLGFVRFNRQAERHALRFDSLHKVEDSDFSSTDNVPALIAEASQAFLGNSTQSLQERAFSMGLPTAIALQADYRLRPHLYVGAVVVQRVPLWRYSVKRPGTVALVPRFEHRWGSVSLPVVLQEGQKLRLGLAARLGYLYVGTDNLGSFFKRSVFTGSDFYIGLKINAFSLNFGGKERSGGGSDRSRAKMRKIKCYEF